jgi:hypothetical protein
MKSTSNRYRPPRIQYKVDAWKKRNTVKQKRTALDMRTKKRIGKSGNGAGNGKFAP